jgi:uncharacterized protein (TIGR03083 family)
MATDLYDAVAAERRKLADAVEGFTDEQWNTPSLCGGWRVRDVVNHLLAGPEVSGLAFVGVMARSGFSFHKANDRVARDDRHPNGELAGALRSNATNRFHPPGFGPEAPLSDLTIHSGDILHPLGLPHEVPADNARVVLPFLVSPKGQRGFGTKGRLDGFSFRATDVDWTHGSGPAVEGPAEPMVMAMGGRMIGFDDLSGDGVTALRARFD